MPGPRVLFFFNHRSESDLADIHAGRRPSERLYGLVELRARGWDAMACDVRHDGRVIPWVAAKLRHAGMDLVGLSVLRAIAAADVLLVKDDLSPALSAAARLLGKPLLYLDSLFELPRHPLRRRLMQANLTLAPRILSYSHFQVELWRRMYGVPAAKFSVLPYTLDMAFYPTLPPSAPTSAAPYVVAAGRDLGRDFDVLLRAAEAAGVGVKLVTLPYLLPASAALAPHVEVLERIDYPTLFALYRSAIGVAVPLKPDILYPSGIRALLEGMAVGRATIATQTPILQEYVREADAAVQYVPPGDVAAWTHALRRLKDDLPWRRGLESAGAAVVRSRYGMRPFVDALERELRAALGARR